jgi:hypothetical protein
MKTIMVHMADRAWTLGALHLACAMARSPETGIILVRMIPVQHLSWLGTEYGYRALTEQEREALTSYQATAEDYGVSLCLESFQYVTLPEAISDAAEYFDAQTVFATLPKNTIPFVRRFQMWTLKRHLARQHCRFFSLERPDGATGKEWTPSVLIQPSGKH